MIRGEHYRRDPRSPHTLPSFPINLAVRETARLFSPGRGAGGGGAQPTARPPCRRSPLSGAPLGGEGECAGSSGPPRPENPRAALHKLPVSGAEGKCKYRRMD